MPRSNYLWGRRKVQRKATYNQSEVSKSILPYCEIIKEFESSLLFTQVSCQEWCESNQTSCLNKNSTASNKDILYPIHKYYILNRFTEGKLMIRLWFSTADLYVDQIVWWLSSLNLSMKKDMVNKNYHQQIQRRYYLIIAQICFVVVSLIYLLLMYLDVSLYKLLNKVRGGTVTQ